MRKPAQSNSESSPTANKRKHTLPSQTPAIVEAKEEHEQSPTKPAGKSKKTNADKQLPTSKTTTYEPRKTVKE
jgi:hypothetical protein